MCAQRLTKISCESVSSLTDTLKIACAGANWKDTFRLNVSLLQFGSKIYSFASSDENSLMQKLQWTRNGKSSRQLQHGKWKKSRVRKDVMLETQREEKKVHFASLMNILSPPKPTELELQIAKIQ